MPVIVYYSLGDKIVSSIKDKVQNFKQDNFIKENIFIV